MGRRALRSSSGRHSTRASQRGPPRPVPVFHQISESWLGGLRARRDAPTRRGVSVLPTAPLQLPKGGAVSDPARHTGDEETRPPPAHREGPSNLAGRGRDSLAGPTQPPHWLRPPGGGASALRSEPVRLCGNLGPGGAGEARVGVERAPAPGKPGLGAMGGEVRLPPGEPCREGECLPRAGGPGIWVAMRSNGLSRVLAEARKGLTPTLDAFTVHEFSQYPASTQPGNSYLLAPTTCQPRWESPSQSNKTCVAPTPGRKGDPCKLQYAESYDGGIQDALGRLPSLIWERATLTHFQSPLSPSSSGQRACPGTGVLCCALRGCERSGARAAGERRTRLGSPHLSLPDEKSPVPPVSRLTRCAVTSWLLEASAQPRGEESWAQSWVGFVLLAGLGFQPLPAPRYLQHPQAFCSHRARHSPNRDGNWEWWVCARQEECVSAGNCDGCHIKATCNLSDENVNRQRGQWRAWQELDAFPKVAGNFPGFLSSWSLLLIPWFGEVCCCLLLRPWTSQKSKLWWEREKGHKEKMPEPFTNSSKAEILEVVTKAAGCRFLDSRVVWPLSK